MKGKSTSASTFLQSYVLSLFDSLLCSWRNPPNFQSERQKKVIQDNLNLIRLSEKVQKMEEDVRRLDDELNMMGRDDAQKALDESRIRRDEEQEKRARCEGRRQGLNEQKRALKKKLNEK